MHTPRLEAVHTSAAASTLCEGGLAFVSKNHQPNEASMSSSPKRMHSLLPLPGTHRGPRCMDVVRHLHSCTGVLQRSVSRISITDSGYYWGISADWARVCSPLLHRVLFIGPTTPESITTPPASLAPLHAALVEASPSTLAQLSRSWPPL
ncbi:hypothetical protein CC86DRAFT_6517 [Ophiobolus disseminans]|uniref:Uncharacterized protein n=1 Tax=Ophiobolus disseminans TaxID=1469910 RepID=A0A6A7AIV5_9PLEO|nr:hypothetical protein CC86DRAFT_6517 [Ophiobolus disseminans]